MLVHLARRKHHDILRIETVTYRCSILLRKKKEDKSQNKAEDFISVKISCWLTRVPYNYAWLLIGRGWHLTMTKIGWISFQKITKSLKLDQIYLFTWW